MEQPEIRLVARVEPLWLDPEDPVEFVRPVDRIRRNIPVPAAEVRDPLGLLEPVLVLPGEVERADAPLLRRLEPGGKCPGGAAEEDERDDPVAEFKRVVTGAVVGVAIQ